MGKFEFEPLIAFPENPLDAARIYFAVMAYPELGAGQPGGAGVGFSASLLDYAMWAHRKGRGRREVRAASGNPIFRPPEWRSFSASMNRGLDRVRRRLVVLDLFQRRQLAALSRSGFRMQPLSEAARQMPSWGGVLNRDVKGWRKRAAINRTGIGGSNEVSEAKDFRRRVIRPSISVLHMAHGLWLVAPDVEAQVSRWSERDPLTAMYLNPDLWIDRAIEAAISWRSMSDHPGFHGELRAHHMIDLVPRKSAE